MQLVFLSGVITLVKTPTGMLGKQLSYFTKLCLAEGLCDFHIRSPNILPFGLRKLLLVLVERLVDLEVKQVLASHDVTGGVNDDVAARVSNSLQLSFEFTLGVLGPDLIGCQCVAITFIVGVQLFVSIRQHTICLVADRLLINLEVRHEAQVGLMLLIVVT